MTTSSLTALQSFLPQQTEETEYASRYGSQQPEEPRGEEVSRDYASLESRTNKIDDLAKALVERCNRSKEFLDNIHRSTFNSNSSDHQPVKEKPPLPTSIAEQTSASTIKLEDNFSARNYLSSNRAQETHRLPETRPLQKRSDLGLREEVDGSNSHQSDD